jgi:hypothetical protein
VESKKEGRALISCRRGHTLGRRAKNQAFLIVCLGVLAVPQAASGQSPATGQESEGDLSGTWSVTVHLTITNEGTPTETHDYKGMITFVPTTTDHYTASGQVNLAPKTDEERIYNIYFQSCARGGHDIEKASPHTYEYKCSYEYGEANRYADGTTTTTVYKGDLTFELNSGTLRGKTRFSVRLDQSDGTMATHAEEAEWTGQRPDGRQDGATTQRLSTLLKQRVKAGQDRIRGLDTVVTADNDMPLP